MEAVFVDNPLAPVVPWKNKIDYLNNTKFYQFSFRQLFSSFKYVAIQHWMNASRQYMCNKLNVDSVGTWKKYSYAIRFLDEALQLVKTEKISDFSLNDEIRTKINNFEFVFCV